MAPKKSTTAATPEASSPKPKTSTTTMTPISINDSPAAKAYTHIHPFVVLGIFVTSFSYLVEDPISSMAATLVPTALLQGVYTTICLPLTSTSATKGKKTKETPGLSHRVVPTILSLFLALAAGTPLLAIALILFGAPFTALQLQTLLCGAHLAVLAGVPLVYAHGVDTAAWLKVAALDVPVDEVFGAAVGTLLGAWVGAVPIPLDWDREWQKWPVTILAGAYAGWAVGKAIGGTVARGGRIRLE